MKLKLRDGEKLPCLAAINTVDKFNKEDFRALQAGKVVQVSQKLGRYLLMWCDESKTKEAAHGSRDKNTR